MYWFSLSFKAPVILVQPNYPANAQEDGRVSRAMALDVFFQCPSRPPPYKFLNCFWHYAEHSKWIKKHVPDLFGHLTVQKKAIYILCFFLAQRAPITNAEAPFLLNCCI